MGLALTDTVASISGTKNEVLTMTLGSMTINAYKNHHFIIYDVVYVIASNTATTITVDTSASIDDLSTLEIKVYVNYASVEQVKRRLASSATDNDGNFINIDVVVDTEIAAMLDDIDEMINEFINLEDETLNTAYFVGTLRKIEVDIISFMFKRAFSYRKFEPVEEQNWLREPAFTKSHKETLRRIKKKIALREGETTFVYNIDTREEIT